MSTKKLAQTLPLVVLFSLFAPGVAHAGKFPLFIIISDNPWLLGIGLVLVVIWFVARSRE